MTFIAGTAMCLPARCRRRQPCMQAQASRSRDQYSAHVLYALRSRL